MALRIIRKSASQSQVELIKGSGEGKADFSLLFFVDSLEAAKKVAAFIDDNVWIQNKAQCLVMKTRSAGQIRSAFTQAFHTIKLLSEPKDASWALRLRTLLKEAQTEVCVFLPTLPAQADLIGLLEHQVDAMHQDRTLAMVGPSFIAEKRLVSAGQVLVHKVPRHTLKAGKETKEVAPEAGLHYLYAGKQAGFRSKLSAGHALLAEAVPLPFSALRRSAYLQLEWKDHAWKMPWLAHDLGLRLKQLQYRVGVLPAPLLLDKASAVYLKPGDMPEGFAERHTRQQDRLFRLYKDHGFKQKGTDFVFAQDHREARIQSYIQRKG